MRSTSAARERLLLFGNYGSGKSHAWSTIAAWYRRFNASGRFYCVSTEAGAVARLSDAYPDFSDNVEWVDVANWRELTEATDKYLALLTPDDWLILESVDRAWDFVQQLWIETKDVRRPSGNPFELEVGIQEAQPDWVRINAVYFNWKNPIVRSAGHVLATAPQEPIRMPQGRQGEWADDKVTIEQFGRFGYKPGGQKRLPHAYHSVLWMQNRAHREWRITTVDDHTREQLVDAPVADFARDYLLRVARWDFDAAELTALLSARAAAPSSETREP